MTPTTLAELETLIRDGVMEDLHREYKDSRAIRKDAREEIAKDVSALANSDGGLIVYGMREKGHLPTEVDEGVGAPFTKEWLESAIMNGISPRLEGVRIHPIQRPEARFVYVVEVPRSYRGPHQAADKKYYRRFNFSAAPMEDYEIRDLRMRRQSVASLVTLSVADLKAFYAAFELHNPGDVGAEDVRIEFPADMPWPPGKGMPQPLRHGIRRLAPKQTLRFRYFAFNEILGEGSKLPAQFHVGIGYFHPETGGRIAEDCLIDFEAYRDSLPTRTREEEILRDAVDELKKLTKEVQGLRDKLGPLAGLVSPTGLRLSTPTMRSLKRIHEGDAPEPMGPEDCTPDVLAEVLEIDYQLAFNIYRALAEYADETRLAELEGVTAEIIERVKSRFRLR